MSISCYFAYGSNMNPARVTERGLAFSRAQGARLSGYQLAFNKVSKAHPTQAHANVICDPLGVVEGVIYHLADGQQIQLMDPYENAPINYGREAVQVELTSASSGPDTKQSSVRIWAWTYFANPAVIVEGLHPSTDYLAHLLAGKAYLSPAYFRQLQQWPTSQ